jgi:GR25 family glycosyltransferase involved in LPS biosynthesis
VAIPIFYINMTTRLDRRKLMEAQFERLGISAERIEAATPLEITAQDRDAYCNRKRTNWMAEAEFACNLSHMRVWATFVNRGLERALILEDDAILSASLPRFLEAMEAPGLDLPLVRLETINLETRVLPPDYQVLPDIALRPAITRDSGACGYILSRDAARQLLERPEMKTTLVDGVLFNPFIAIARGLDVHYADPALAIQLDRFEKTQSQLSHSDLKQWRVDRYHQWSKRPLLKLMLKIKSWIDYDLQLARSRLQYRQGSGLEVKVIPFKVD